ncbi:MAG: exodeoxyribonuclease VII large subunit [Bacilli bacterium]|nr:exodeoxyribonuclease VII large subunit [Bacilli bacterium]
MNDKYITVTQLTRYIKYKIDNDIHLNEVFLKGEISNFKAHSRGHFYFTLKDEGSRINAIMFSSNTKKLKFTPEEGMKVFVTGKISVYEATGSYQIYVSDLEEDGVGNLYIAYEQLKKKLQEEGLFREELKKPIKKYPSKIGVVTAPTGAAIKDIISTIKRRWPLVKIYLFPSLVQGENAKEDIVKQIKLADTYHLDTLIVGRGGGSIEDLWAFNEECVARAIYECKTPVISAVGHEIDFTISDFVADLRAPTPTGAAEMAVPQLNDVMNYINQLQIRLKNQILNKIKNGKERLEWLKNRNILKNPMMLYEPKEIEFSNLLEKLKYSLTNCIHQKEKDFIKIKNSYILQKPYQILDKKSNKYLQLLSKLETLSPLLTLQRGYTITKKDDKIINSIKDIKIDDLLKIELKDGKVDAKVIKKE